MRRKLWLVALGGGVLLAAGLVAYCLLVASSRPPVHADRAAHDRIRVGMTGAEVEALLGGPPGDYTTGPCMVTAMGLWAEGATYRDWVSDEGSITVAFDPDGRVVGKVFNQVSRMDRGWGPLEQLRRLLRRFF
jgi:hypothetical protein